MVRPRRTLYAENVKVATVFNHAGGAGKTSVTRDVGYELAQRGLRVLLIDLDPQANLSSWLGVKKVGLDSTVYSVLLDDAALPDPVQVFGLDIIPSQVDLAAAEALMLGIPGVHSSLKKALKKVQDRYDLVLIDCPPSISQLTLVGGATADHLLVPIPTRSKGIDAMPGLQKAMSVFRRVNEEATVALYIPTMYDARRSHDREVYELFQRSLSPLSDPMPERAAVWLDSNQSGQPVGVYAPGSPVHKDIVHLADQVAAALKVGV